MSTVGHEFHENSLHFTPNQMYLQLNYGVDHNGMVANSINVAERRPTSARNVQCPHPHTTVEVEKRQPLNGKNKNSGGNIIIFSHKVVVDSSGRLL